MPEKNRNKYGLTPRDMDTILSILVSDPGVKMVSLFGSRAKGTHRLGSNVDLAIMNKGVSSKKLAHLKSEFEESTLPYNVDLVDYTRLEKKKFIDHINRVGTAFYKKGELVPVE